MATGFGLETFFSVCEGILALVTVFDFWANASGSCTGTAGAFLATGFGLETFFSGLVEVYGLILTGVRSVAGPSAFLYFLRTYAMTSLISGESSLFFYSVLT